MAGGQARGQANLMVELRQELGNRELEKVDCENRSGVEGQE